MKLRQLFRRGPQDAGSGAVFKGMLTLAMGSGGARLISIATIPIVTRLYTPDDFGVLSVFSGLVLMLAPLVTLRYGQALPLPHHNGAAMNLLVLTLGLVLSLSALVAVGLWLWGDALLRLLSMEVLTPWWWLIVLGVLGTAGYETLTMWATRARAYKLMARTQVIQSLAGAGVKVGLGVVGVQPMGLLIGQIVNQAGGTGRFLSQFRPAFRANWRHVTRGRLVKLAWRYRGFPIWRLPSRFLMAYTDQMPVLFIAGAYGAAASGQFAVSTMILGLPVMLLGQTMSNAFYAELSQKDVARSPEWRYRLAKGVLLRFGGLAGLLVAGVWLLADVVQSVVLGAQWDGTAVVMKILVFSYALRLLYSPLSTSFSLLEKHKIYLFLNILRAVLLSGLFALIAFVDATFQMALVAYVVVASLHYSLSVFLAIRVLKPN